MTSATAELCKCGLPMKQALGPGWVCENCDNVQPQEPYVPDSRNRTVNDIRFDAYWEQQMAEYEDKTEKKDPRCEDCLVPEHDTCSLTPGCPCCDNTIEKMAEGETT